MTTLTYPEELERKVWEAAETYTLRHQQGVLSNREYKLVMDALWQASSGLVGGLQEIMQGVVDLGLKDEPIRAAFANQRGHIATIKREGRWITWGIPSGLITSREFDTEADAVSHFNDIKTTFEGKGFSQL